MGYLCVMKYTKVLVKKSRWPEWHRNNPPEKRFWDKVDKKGPDECWNWSRSVDGGGYGFFRCIQLGEQKTHRLAWILTNGKIPKGIQVCHKCDNPRCCNPKHLFLGTYYDNMRDAMAKGRQPVVKGSGHICAKLKECNIPEIRNMISYGMTQKQVGFRFGVHQSVISEIINGKAWTHVN